MQQISSLELAKKNSRPDEKIVELSSFLVMRIMPDKSVIIYRSNGIETIMFSLTFEYIKQMYEELIKD